MASIWETITQPIIVCADRMMTFLPLRETFILTLLLYALTSWAESVRGTGMGLSRVKAKSFAEKYGLPVQELRIMRGFLTQIKSYSEAWLTDVQCH